MRISFVPFVGSVGLSSLPREVDFAFKVALEAVDSPLTDKLTEMRLFSVVGYWRHAIRMLLRFTRLFAAAWTAPCRLSGRLSVSLRRASRCF